MKRYGWKLFAALILLIVAVVVLSTGAMAGVIYTINEYGEITQAVGDGSYFTVVVIPSEINGIPVTSIGDNAFGVSDMVEHITIPSGVTRIGDGAFSGSYALTSIEIPDSVTSIGAEAFYLDKSLGEVLIPDGVTSISDATFSYCRSLHHVAIPAGVTSIGSYAFSGCSSLLSIEIPERVTYIGPGAFSNCSSLTSVTIPEGVTGIYLMTFSGCSSLTNVTIPSSVVNIAPMAFSDCVSLKEVEFPVGLEDIANTAFSGCINLEKAVFLDKATVIDGDLFSGGDVMIHCYRGSTAEAMALEYGYDIVYLGEGADIELRNLENGEIIDGFQYACGSYMFDAADCSKVELYYCIENNSSQSEGTFMLTLPDGFSFEPYSIRQTEKLDIKFDGKDVIENHITVYPMYSQNMPEYLEFRIEADEAFDFVEANCVIPVTPAKDEGKILCRNTVGVSNLDPAIPIEIDNTVDFAKEFNTSVSTFSDRLNELGCALTQAVYVEDFMMQSFENLGFTNAVYLHGLDDHDVGCAIAQKKVILGGRVDNILMVVVRGTLDTEWIGNFVVVDENSPNEHADFRNAANKVLERIAEYWNRCNLGENKDNIQMYICGHSRAAAATNLIVHDMNQANKPVSSDRLRAYTYATPNSTKNGTGVAYSNLYNYMFLHDFVAYVPNGYEKHGQTYVVGKDGATEKVVTLFESEPYSGGQEYIRINQPYFIGIILATGEEANKFASREAVSSAIGYTVARILPQGNGEIPQAHGAEGYLAWVNGNGINGQISFNAALKHMRGLAQDEFDKMAKIYGYSAKVVGTRNIPMYVLLRSMEMLHDYMGNRLLMVSCPVDVEVLDASGAVIASFNSHELQSADQTRVVAFSMDETDYILMPRDEELSVRITGTEDGVMTLKLVQVDGSESDFELDESDVSARASYIDVPLTAGESYRMAFATAGAATEWVLYDHEGNVYKGDAIQNAVYLPKALTELWDEAYMGISAMKGNIVCPENITSIGERAFADSGIEGIYIPAGCKLIAKSAFENINPVIYCMEGSFAHIFAQTNGYEFVLMANPIG